jgi:thiol reductant ABC exporter CydC subunit
MARGLARYGERLSGHDAALGAVAGLRDRVFRALVAQFRPRSADALGAAVHDVDAVQDLLVRCVIPVAGAVLVCAVSVAGVWWVSPAAGPVVMGGLLVALVLVPVVAALWSRRSDGLVAACRAELTGRVVDLFRGAAELTVTGAGASARAGVADAARRLTARQRSVPAHGATAVVLLVAGGTAVGAFRVTTNPVAAIVLTLVVFAAFDVCVPLPAAARQLARIAGSVRRIRTLVDVADVPLRDREVTGPPEVVVEALDVRYRAGDPLALQGIDLWLPPGRKIAVVGESGSGKSTLLAALARFVPPSAGRIAIAGTGLAQWPEAQLRRTVGGVLSDAHVFHDTIAANLRIGRPDATDAELAAVADRMRLLGWIESLPDGWRTVLGTDAALASGGQRQRLLLARALLADPAVLLLDEPTEGLDPDTADAVLADLLSASAGRSVVLATHRLTGLAALDEVMLLDAGRVRQRGSPAELAAVPGPYRDLWRIREVVG